MATHAQVAQSFYKWVSTTLETEVLNAYPKELEGKFSIGFDGWTAPNGRPFIGVMAHGVKDGQAFTFALDFIELKAAHTGDNMAVAIKKSLDEFGVADKVSNWLWTKHVIHDSP